MIAEKVFAEGVAKDIRNYLPPEYEDADFQVVQKNKNNGIQLIGVQVNLPERNASPIIYIKSFNRFLIISLDVLICRYSPLFRAFPALFISEEPHKSFYYPSCFRSQK